MKSRPAAFIYFDEAPREFECGHEIGSDAYTKNLLQVLFKWIDPHGGMEGGLFFKDPTKITEKSHSSELILEFKIPEQLQASLSERMVEWDNGSYRAYMCGEGLRVNEIYNLEYLSGYIYFNKEKIISQYYRIDPKLKSCIDMGAIPPKQMHRFFPSHAQGEKKESSPIPNKRPMFS